MVGVDTYTIFLFQNVVSRFSASSSGSPSLPAENGYLSISSANSARIGLEASELGEFAPTMVTCPPGKTFCNIVLPLVRLLSLMSAANTGVSRIIGERRSFEYASPICKVGSIVIIGDGSLCM